MAAINCHEREAVRDLHIVSFENDLDSLKLAFRNNDQFHDLRDSAPAAILKESEWTSKFQPGLSWTLVPGNFLEADGGCSRAAGFDFPRHVFRQDERGSLDAGRIPAALRGLPREECRAVHLHLLDRITCRRRLAAGFFVWRGNKHR